MNQRDLRSGGAGLADHDQEPSVPVVVTDLDGTLIQTDLLVEGLVAYTGRNPLRLFQVIRWRLAGKAVLKREIAKRHPVDAAHLPYNQEVLDFLRERKSRNAKIVLATGADQAGAHAVAGHLGIFDQVIASDGHTNRRGQAKADAVRQAAAGQPFLFMGDDTADIAVFEAAAESVLVDPSRQLGNAVRKRGVVKRVIRSPRNLSLAIWKALRPHHWIKNLLIFAPAAAGHKLLDPGTLAVLTLAFVCLSMLASALYIFNDALDVAADRRHGTKNRRPLATGALRMVEAIAVMGVLITACFGLSFLLPGHISLALVVYGVSSISYSMALKSVHLLDVFMLVGLYLLRLAIGHSVAQIQYSFWFMMFFGFAFTGLALLKRFSETKMMTRRGAAAVAGRGYLAEDSPILAALGTGSTIAASVILALYLNSDAVLVSYAMPMALAPICPAFLFVMFRLWMLASRSELDKDPVLYLVTDYSTYLMAAVAAGSILLAI